jgi:predicted dehydrogenase
MRAVVVGYGSIGARHARVLSELGCSTAVVSRRLVDYSVTFPSIGEALDAERPDFIVVANETSAHVETVMSLVELGYTGTVLVEKPLFSQVYRLPEIPFRSLLVAYNLRFHPAIQRLRELLTGAQVLSVQAYVGHHLPAWRPLVDYRTSYSAYVALGGGALRDISHELDYLTWLLGGWSSVAAVGGHFSLLEIDSDDVFSLMLDTPACPVVSLQLNYLDTVGRRFMLINTARNTILVDLVKGIVMLDGESETFNVERDMTYREMHKAMLAGDLRDICSLREGEDTMCLIEAAELASKNREWVNR